MTPPRPLKCVHEGQIQQWCPRGDELLHVRDCSIHESCTRGAGRVKSCASCNDYTDGRIVLDQGGSGLGDALAGLVAVAGLKAEMPEAHIEYRVHHAAIPWVNLFHGFDSLGTHYADHWSQETPGARQLNIGYDSEWVSRFAAGPRWERYARNIGAGRIAVPPLKEPERLRELGKPYRGCVVLCPFSLHDVREWPLANWVELERLLIADGFRTVVMHSKAQADGHRSLEGFKGEIVCGLSPARTAGIMLNARLVIGNDSGMAHLAGILKRPVLVLCGDYPGDAIFGCYPGAKCIEG